MSISRLLDLFVVVQGVAGVLFIGYIVMWGRPAFLLPPVDTGLREVVIVVAMRGVHQTPPIVCIRTEVVGGFTTIGAMIPEPAIPTLLGVVAGSSAGVDRWYHTSWLGPSYRLSVWFDPLYNVVYAGGHFGSLETFFDIDLHFG